MHLKWPVSGAGWGGCFVSAPWFVVKYIFLCVVRAVPEDFFACSGAVFDPCRENRVYSGIHGCSCISVICITVMVPQMKKVRAAVSLKEC